LEPRTALLLAVADRLLALFTVSLLRLLLSPGAYFVLPGVEVLKQAFTVSQKAHCKIGVSRIHACHEP
jgi:hypothetical protein